VLLQNRIVKPLAVAFIKHCLVPRLTRSLADATFCHHFTMVLHTMDTPNWPAAFFWDYVSYLCIWILFLLMSVYYRK
jgi:hypothetical protein